MTPRRASRFTSLSFVPRYRHAPWRTRQGLAGSWGALCMRLPCSTTPPRSSRLASKDVRGAGSCRWPVALPPVPHSVLGRGLAAFAARRCCPRGWVIRRHESSPTFEAPSHGLRTRCLRFARSLPSQRLSAYARLASGWWPTFASCRAPTRFQSFHLHDFLLSRLSCRKPTLGRDSAVACHSPSAAQGELSL